MLSLMEDGSAEYFESSYFVPRVGKKWTYADRKIHIHYYDTLELCSDAADLESKEYWFVKESGSGNWIDETYTKVSDDAIHLSYDIGVKIIKDEVPELYPDKSQDIIGKISPITYKDFSFGDVVFQIPSHFSKSSEGCFLSTDRFSKISLFTYEQGVVSNSVFISHLSSLDREFDTKIMESVNTPKRYYDTAGLIAGLQSSEAYYTGTVNNSDVHCKTALINNPHFGRVVRILFIYCDETPDYSDVYDYMLETAVLATEEHTATESAEGILIESRELDEMKRIDWCKDSKGNSFIEKYNSLYPTEAIKRSDIIFSGWFSTEIRVTPDIVYNVSEADGDPCFEIYGFSEYDEKNRATMEEYARRLSKASGIGFNIKSYYGDSPIQAKHKSLGMVISYYEAEEPFEKTGFPCTMYYFIYTDF